MGQLLASGYWLLEDHLYGELRAYSFELRVRRLLASGCWLQDV